MKSKDHGKNISQVEVTNISMHGIWIFIKDQEFFMPFDDFPWFKEAPVRKILNVEMLSENHAYWPDLDIDLDINQILHPENYPLVSKRSERVKDDGEIK